MHTGCLSEDGRVFMWGDVYGGQIGLYLNQHGWVHERRDLYPEPLEMNLDFLTQPITV